MQKYKSNITSTTGAAIRNVPVTVLTETSGLASLFLDRAGAIAAPNPLSTDSSGNFYFYAVNGRYSLRTTVEGVTITDDDVVLMNDPAEIATAGPIAEAVAAAKNAAQQAQDAVEASGIPDLVAAAQNAVVDAGQALQEAREASQASASAKQAAESAQLAAEVAQRDAQAASTESGAASEQATAAALAAALSAASIDPAAIYSAIGKKVDAQPGAGLLTDAERLKLGDIDGLRDELNARVRQTSVSGAAVLPQGPVTGLPPALPAEGLLARGNADGKPTWFDRSKNAWRIFSADEIAQLSMQMNALDAQLDFKIIYPNGGTAAAPANVVVNSRYVMANPFPGFPVMCVVELKPPGREWGEPGFLANTSGQGYGAKASAYGDSVVIQTGAAGLFGLSASEGNPWGWTESSGAVATPIPCRVKVWKLKGSV